MHIYCLYQINGSGQFRRLLEFEAQDDLSAIAEAEARRKNQAIQLWSKGKLVKEWSAVGSAESK